MTTWRKHGQRAGMVSGLAGAELARQWTATADAPGRYPRIAITRTVPIQMDDGVVLRGQIYRPADAAGRPIDDPLPVLINLSPYNRLLTANLIDWLLQRSRRRRAEGAESRSAPLFGDDHVLGGGFDLMGVNRALVRSGYVQVVVDVRGTGGSTGIWGILDDREQRDTAEVVAWAQGQPWCDGSVGMYGASYLSINTLQAAGNRVPGLGAVFAVEPAGEIRRDIMKTGGTYTLFVLIWMLMIAVNKWFPSPWDMLDRGIRWRWLADRLRVPLNSTARYHYEALVVGRGAKIDDDARFDGISPRIENIEIPTFVYGVWDDIFGPAVLSIFQRLHLGHGHAQAIISQGYHVTLGARLGGADTPPRLDVLQRAWFDKWLKGIDNGIEKYGPVTLQQQGGSWQTLASFPRPTAVPRRFYLDAETSCTGTHAAHDGSLTDAAPRIRTEHRLHRKLVALKSPSSSRTSAGFFQMDDARPFEQTALTFTSAAVEESWVISGPMSLHLLTRAFGAEACWVVTVNDVAPDGSSHMLADGALLSSRRGVNETRSLKTADGDYLSAWHPTDKGARLPVEPGVPTVLDIDLSTVDAVITPGHRVRVVISAASLPRFIPSIPELWASRTGQSILLEPDQPSYLVAPVVTTAASATA